MTRTTGTVVVVGGSIGGVRTAQALRTEGFTGRIVLVGREAELPYDKPPLSKQLLIGAWGTERITLLDADTAEQSGIELCLGVGAVRLDVAGRRVVLDDGTELGFGAVVLATGARARPSPWDAESGVHVLRSLADATALRRDLAATGSLVVIGGGFIGAEVAAAARALGREVVVVDPLPAPIARVVGSSVAERFTELHHRHGVGTHFGVGVEGVRGGAGDLRVQLTDGTELCAGTVVVGIGATPEDAWLRDSGLLIDDGVVCDEHGRAADSPDVYAVGDVARWYHTGHEEHVRVEHWTNAVEQAAIVAHNIVHPAAPREHQPVEYVWSDQYDWKVQIVGRPGAGIRHELLGDLSGAQARGAAVYTDDSGLLRGAVTVNWPKALVTCRRLVAATATFDDALAQLAQLPARRPASTP